MMSYPFSMSYTRDLMANEYKTVDDDPCAGEIGKTLMRLHYANERTQCPKLMATKRILTVTVKDSQRMVVREMKLLARS